MKKSLKRKFIVLLTLCFICSNSLLMVKAKEQKEGSAQKETPKEVLGNIDIDALEENKESLSIGDVAITKDNFPDANFLATLEAAFSGAGVITAAQIAEIKVMNLKNSEILNLKGIEHFTALEELSCYDGQLISLDVSKNTALTYLWCGNNQLSVLDVSKNTKLKELYCYSNQLTTLDISKNTALEGLDCSDTKLTTLDVSKNTELIGLVCQNNQLTTLDVSKNTKLDYLDCQNNKLTYLNVPATIANFFAEGQINSIAIKAEEDMYDLMNFGVGMDVTKISDLQGATLEGTKLKGLKIGQNVSYTYDCGNGEAIDVILEVEEKAEAPTTPTPPNTEKPAPTTGDTTNTTVLFMMMGTAVIIFARKRMGK